MFYFRFESRDLSEMPGSLDQGPRYALVCRRVYGGRGLPYPFFRAMPSRPAVQRLDAGAAHSLAITHLAVDPVDLPILILELAAHVDRHVPQIADHRVHLAHVLLHFPFARVIRDLGDIAALRPETVTIVHHPLRLIVHDLAVVITLPCALVLFEAGASVRARSSRERRD